MLLMSSIKIQSLSIINNANVFYFFILLKSQA